MIFLCVIILLLIYSIFTTFQLVKLARIIFLIEDELPDMMNTVNENKAIVEAILEKKHYFDSVEDVKMYNQLLDLVKIVRLNLVQLIVHLTKWSKEKYLPTESRQLQESNELGYNLLDKDEEFFQIKKTE